MKTTFAKQATFLSQRRNYTRNYRANVVFWVLLAILFSVASTTAQPVESFGYDHMRVNGVQALGERPLLTILANFAGGKPWVHEANDYDSLIYTFAQPSVNGYFAENSQGRFLWRKAYPMVGPVQCSVTGNFGAQMDDPALISEVVKLAAIGIDFSQWDSNSDGSVTGDELCILIIHNVGDVSGATRNIAPAGFLDLNGVRVSSLVSTIEHRASLMTFCHELMHQLGALDLYGGDCKGCLNRDITLMGATIYENLDDRRTYHLDPWHKLQLGWVKPRLRDLRRTGSDFLFATQTQNEEAPIILFDSRFNTSEFFILEYRSKKARGGGYDKNVYTEGMAVWHVQQQDDHVPTIIPNPREWAVFHEGGEFDAGWKMKRGGSFLWKGGMITPRLKWLSGVPLPVRFYVEPYVRGAAQIVVNWVNWNEYGGEVFGGEVYSENLSGRFRRADGLLKEIEAGNEMSSFVWGINGQGKAFRLHENTRKFNYVDERFKQLSVNWQGQTWGITGSEWVYRCLPYTNNFTNLRSELSQVATGEGGVWGLNDEQEIFRFNEDTGAFEQVAGRLIKIAVGFTPEDVWGINANNEIYHFNPATQEFEAVNGSLVQIIVSKANTQEVWGINEQQEIFRYNRDTGEFQQIPGRLVKMSIGLNSIWGINTAHEIYKFDGNTQRFQQVPGSLMSISVTAEGAAWGINAY